MFLFRSFLVLTVCIFLIRYKLLKTRMTDSSYLSEAKRLEGILPAISLMPDEGLGGFRIISCLHSSFFSDPFLYEICLDPRVEV